QHRVVPEGRRRAALFISPGAGGGVACPDGLMAWGPPPVVGSLALAAIGASRWRRRVMRGDAPSASCQAPSLAAKAARSGPPALRFGASPLTTRRRTDCRWVRQGRGR